MIKSETMVLLLAVGWLSACTSWTIQSASPQQVLAEHQPEKVRVTRADSTTVVLNQPEIVGRHALRDRAIAGLRRARRPKRRGSGGREVRRYPERGCDEDRPPRGAVGGRRGWHPVLDRRPCLCEFEFCMVSRRTWSDSCRGSSGGLCEANSSRMLNGVTCRSRRPDHSRASFGHRSPMMISGP